MQATQRTQKMQSKKSEEQRIYSREHSNKTNKPQRYSTKREEKLED